VSYLQAPNQFVAAANGVDYACRETGRGDIPFVLLQHFRGNLDNWDQALVEALASDRRVIAFDNTGAGGVIGATLRIQRSDSSPPRRRPGAARCRRYPQLRHDRSSAVVPTIGRR